MTFKTAGSQTITATDTVSGITGTSSSGVTVNPAAAAKFLITNAPTSTVAGSPFSFTVTAEDIYGNVATGYAGTVRFASTDKYPQTSLPGYSTLSGGTGTFTAILTKAGAQTIVATDTLLATVTGKSGSITVTAAAAAALRVAVPAQAAAGAAITVTVTLIDQYGNVTTYGAAGSVQLSSSDGLAVVPVSKSFAKGTATFSMKLGTKGGQTITATDSSDGLSGISATIAVLGGELR